MIALSPDEMTAARRVLGERWGLERALTYGEMARLLRLKPANGAETVMGWEEGRPAISGPVSVAVEMMLAGAEPPTKAEALERTGPETRAKRNTT